MVQFWEENVPVCFSFFSTAGLYPCKLLIFCLYVSDFVFLFFFCACVCASLHICVSHVLFFVLCFISLFIFYSCLFAFLVCLFVFLKEIRGKRHNLGRVWGGQDLRDEREETMIQTHCIYIKKNPILNLKYSWLTIHFLPYTLLM